MGKERTFGLESILGGRDWQGGNGARPFVAARNHTFTSVPQAVHLGYLSMYEYSLPGVVYCRSAIIQRLYCPMCTRMKGMCP